MKTNLPGVIIIGAQRCGTTRFFNLLNRHPQISAGKKEIHFYDLRFNRGLLWYGAQFPKGDLINIEASPYYIYHPLCAERIYESQPDVKIIALLRNPVDRTYSNYHHELRRGMEELSFEDAMLAEPVRTEGEEERIISLRVGFSPGHNQFSYFQRSIYFPQLMRYYDLFDRGNIMIVRSEDFYEDEQAVLLSVQEFMGLELVPGEIGTFGGKKKYPAMSSDTRKALIKFFEPYNNQLEEFLGRDFGWNK